MSKQELGHTQTLVVVPMMPTKPMIEAAWAGMSNKELEGDDAQVEKIWRDMLAACDPQPSVTTLLSQVRQLEAEVERLKGGLSQQIEKTSRALNQVDIEAERAGNFENDKEALEAQVRQKDEALRAIKALDRREHMDVAQIIAGRALSPTPQPDAERCPICSWPYAESREKGCVPGDCSYRPREGTAEYERVKRNRERVTQPDAAPADDIVARLRLHQIEEGKSFFALWDEAANEIERLLASPLPADDVVERTRQILNSRMNGAPNINSFKVEETISEFAAANLLRQSAPVIEKKCTCGANGVKHNVDDAYRCICDLASPPADMAGMRELKRQALLAPVKMTGGVFSSKNDDWLLGFQDGVHAKNDAIRALPSPEPKTDAARVTKKSRRMEIRHALLSFGVFFYEDAGAAIDRIAELLSQPSPTDAAVKALERIAAVELGEQKETEAHWPARLMQSIAREALAANGVK